MDQDSSLFEIVATAMDLPSGERHAYIAATCGSDDILAERVARMIAAEKEMGEFLAEPAEEALSILNSLADHEVEANEALEQPPDMIGRYRVIRRIGRGGMGNVYLGRQQIGGFSRDVAIKVIRRGMDSESVVARFRMERSILASLNHPNIARLHDAGTTTDGRAFYVMEYVDGLPITEYCDAYRLSVEQRLHLFETVCRAAHYAHQNLVVHRDIKPTNILVTAEGTVKLLDFGIAKLLDPAATDYTVPVTGADATLLTPDYASPEQIRGEAISTSTDVYSLGVLLYELLSGHRPFRSSAESRAAFAMRVCDEDPRKPSSLIESTVSVTHRDGSPGTITTDSVCEARRSTPRLLRGTLTGELDNIVLKAIRKSPDDRYASVEQLREDLERYRCGEPVIARPATITYRLKKAYSRHRFGTLGTAFVLLAVILLTGFYIRELSSERRIAEQAYRRAENVKGFVIGLFEQGAYGGGITKDEQVQATLTLLEPALENLDRFDDDPISRVDILNVVGEVLIANASNDRAIDVLGEALEIGDREQIPILAQAETWHQLGKALFNSGKLDSAHHHLSRAYNVRIAGLGPLDDATLASQAHRAWSAPQGPVRMAQYAEVVAQYERAYGSESVKLADLLSDIGQGAGDQSIAYFERALDIYEKTTGLDHPLAATTMANLSIGIEAEDSTRSLQLQTDAHAILAKSVGEIHPLTLSVLRNVGAMHAERKNYRIADSLLARVDRGFLELDPGYSQPRVALLYWHSIAVHGLQEYETARQKLAILTEALPRVHGRYPHVLKMYLESLVALHRVDEARAFYAEVLPDLKESEAVDDAILLELSSIVATRE